MAESLIKQKDPSNNYLWRDVPRLAMVRLDYNLRGLAEDCLCNSSMYCRGLAERYSIFMACLSTSSGNVERIDSTTSGNVEHIDP